LLFAVTVVGGCYNPGTGAIAVVFPIEGKAGDGANPGTTAFMFIDSNYIPFGDSEEWLDLDRSRVRIITRELEPPWLDVPANLRALVNVEAGDMSSLGLLQPGVTGVVAIFDLPSHEALAGPTSYPLDYPIDAQVWVELDGTIPQTLRPRVSPIKIVDKGGQPQQLMTASLWPGAEQILENSPEPIVRIRPMRDQSVDPADPPTAFREGWEIGSMEFWFRYEDDCIGSILEAQAQTDAKRGSLVVVGPRIDEGSESKQRVHFVSPTGLTLAFVSVDYFDDTLAGHGPILDLMVDRIDETCDVSTSYQIRALIITDLDGAVLLESPLIVPVDYGNGTEEEPVFRVYLVDPPAPI
jgi:hypothetical protein